MPSTKARRWAVGVNKELGNVLAQIEDIPRTNVGSELQTLYTQRFGDQKSKLTKFKGDLETCGDDSAAKTLVTSAPAVILASKQLRQKWAKILKSASD